MGGGRGDAGGQRTMWAGDIDTGRELPDAAPPRYAAPLLFSVLLHGTVLFLFTRSLFSGPPATDPAEERPGIRVALVVRAPLAPEEPVVPELEESDLPEPEVEESIPPEPELAESAPGEPRDLPQARAAELLAEAAPQAPAPSEDELQDNGGVDAGNAEQAWTPARIRTALAITAAVTLVVGVYPQLFARVGDPVEAGYVG